MGSRRRGTLRPSIRRPSQDEPAIADLIETARHLRKPLKDASRLQLSGRWSNQIRAASKELDEPEVSEYLELLTDFRSHVSVIGINCAELTFECIDIG